MIIVENYFLLIESNKKIYFRWSASRHLRFGGAILMDLSLKRKISINGNYLEIIDSSTTKHPYLDKIIEFLKTYIPLLKSYKNVNILEKCIVKLAFGIKNGHPLYYNDFLKGLERQGILKFEEKTIKKIFSPHRFYLQKLEVKRDILEKIKHIVVDKERPDDNLLCLLSLMNKRNLKRTFSKEFQRQAKKRIDELINSEATDKKIQDMFLSITRAISNIENAMAGAAGTVGS